MVEFSLGHKQRRLGVASLTRLNKFKVVPLFVVQRSVHIVDVLEQAEFVLSNRLDIVASWIEFAGAHIDGYGAEEGDQGIC